MVELLTEIVNMPELKFYRSAKPEGAQGPPEIIVFWDGANPAYSGNIYLRWQVPVCQNQAGVPLPLYKFIRSDGDPAAEGVQELPDVEMGNDADEETDAQSYKFVTRLLAGKARLSRLTKKHS